jgi:predicted PurR-regulated permease PerM
MASNARGPSLRHHVAAWLVAAVLLFLTLYLRLLPALLAGLLVHELVHLVAPRLTLLRNGRAKIVVVALITVAVVTVLAGIMLGIAALLQGDHDSFARLLQKMAEIVDNSRGKLPPWVMDALPGDADALRTVTTEWLRVHSGELRIYGGEVGHGLLHMLIGMVIGAIASLGEALPATSNGPLAQALGERARRLADAFRRIVFAQVRISALNTVFTAIYLLAVLPLFGVHLPFAKTLVAVTFLAGLLPVVGNLISNTIIVIVSLNVSLQVALASLGFLIVVHKLEYFLNARIVGSRIHAKMWELLVAMLLMEAAFGIAGLVAAPIFYAYLKDELAARGQV